jgi:hypothetical protein
VGIAVLGAVMLLGALVAESASVPIDFTGHWIGTASGKSPVTLTADLTSSGRTVTGTLSATQGGQPENCTLNGRQIGRVKLKAKLTPCDVALQGKFDAATDTITGHYVNRGHHKRQTGTFSLTRAASPSGAFIDRADSQ